MARVHTDFIILDENKYDLLISLLPLYVNCTVLYDVKLNEQRSLERHLEKKGKFVLKRKYVE